VYGPPPPATTVKVAVAGSATDWLVGCVTIVAGVGAVTVKVARLLSTEPRPLVITT
jgi:hypothetical protein